jgi:hypothetical protein
MITLKTKTLNSFNSLVSPETTFGTNLKDMCSIGEWKEIVLDYTYDVLNGSIVEDILGKDVYFLPALFNRGGEVIPAPPVVMNGFWANITNADLGNDVEMTLSTSSGVANPTKINWKCYINSSNGIDFSIKFQFYLTFDMQKWLDNSSSKNQYRFTKNYETNPTQFINTGSNLCVYNGKGILDTYLKISDGVNTPEQNRSRIDFYAKFYNENSYYENPVFEIRDSNNAVIPNILPEDCKVTFTVDKVGGNAQPMLVAYLIQTNSLNNGIDFLSNYDFSGVQCDGSDVDNNIILPSNDFVNTSGNTWSGYFTIKGSNLSYGNKYRIIAISYSEDLSEKMTASFISDEYSVGYRALTILNPSSNAIGIPDFHTKESYQYTRADTYITDFKISYINERIAFNCLSVFSSDDNIGHPNASIVGFEQYCTQIRARIYRFDGVYRHVYAEQIIKPDWSVYSNSQITDINYNDTFIGNPSVKIYKRLMEKSTFFSGSSANGYFFDWWIRSRCESNKKVMYAHLPTSENQEYSADVQYWGGKKFGIEYEYTFLFPDTGGYEIVNNAFDDIFEVMDFDNIANPAQTCIIQSIKDNSGKDISVRKYICDSDADLTRDNDGLWLKVNCKLSQDFNGGDLSVMISPNPTNQYNLQEVNKVVTEANVTAEFAPLTNVPQVTDSSLIRNMVGWSQIATVDGSASFELNIDKLIPGVDYKLYVIHVLTFEI